MVLLRAGAIENLNVEFRVQSLVENLHDVLLSVDVEQSWRLALEGYLVYLCVLVEVPEN